MANTIGKSSVPSVIKKNFDRLRACKSELLILDGGTGEELFRRGVPDDRQTWSATACVHGQYHDILKQVHQSFVGAGSDAITTNSYGIVPVVGFSLEEIAEHVATAGRIARESAEKDTIVLGSLGPLNGSYRPDLIFPQDKGVRIYQIVAHALEPYIDCFLAETMSCYSEASQVVEAIASLNIPIMVSFTLRSEGTIRNGEPASQCLRKIIDFSLRQNIQLLGVLFNCAEPEAVTVALQNVRSDRELNQILTDNGIILGAYAHRLAPMEDPEWTMAESEAPQPMREDIEPAQYYNDFISKWISDLGVQMVGGCCGITPEHISYIKTHHCQ